MDARNYTSEIAVKRMEFVIESKVTCDFFLHIDTSMHIILDEIW